MRDLSREDRDAFNRAKQKEWTSWLDKEAVELVKDRLKVPRNDILRARWVLSWKNVGTEKVPKARLCALGFQHPHLTTLTTKSPTLTSDGESAILQWIVNKGQLLESGDLKTAFLSGDPDPAHKGSDALYIDPPSELKTLVETGTRRCVEIAKSSLRPHQRTSSMASKAQPSPPTSWLCVTANRPLCLDSPCVQSCESCASCRCANQVESSRCRLLGVTCS